MFSSISWQQYIIFLVISLLIYYVLIGFLYFRVEISGLFKKDKTRNSFLDISSQVIKEEKADNSILFPAVHELMEDLKDIIVKNPRKETHKEELIIVLKERISNYPQLKETVFAASINNFLQQELPLLEEADIKRLWK